MKIKHNQFAFVNPRALLVFGIVCCIATGTLVAFLRSDAQTNSLQRTLTFAERIAYQRAIEDVYWRHRIWPKENSKPKPSLDAPPPRHQVRVFATTPCRGLSLSR